MTKEPIILSIPPGASPEEAIARIEEAALQQARREHQDLVAQSKAASPREK